MKVKKFPEPLDDPSKLSPELLVLWAKKAVWSTEIKTLKKRIEEFDDESIEADKRLTLEQKEKAEIHVEQMEKDYENAQAGIKELKEVLKEYNPFLEVLEKKRKEIEEMKGEMDEAHKNLKK